MVVSVHLAAFEQFFLTALGPLFLRQYYRCVVAYPQGIALGAFVEGEIAGFVAGFVNPPAFYSTLHSSWLKFALAALPGLLMRPNHIVRILANYRRSKMIANDQRDQSTVAELSSLAVATGFNETGIGTDLVQNFCAEARTRGTTLVVLTTDTYRNERGNRFYQRIGFQLARTFEAQPGRYLNEYHMKLSPEGITDA